MILGIFDSGLGGLTVLKEIIKNNVYNKIIYYGDTKRVPYGDKDKQTLKQYAKEDIDFLISKGAEEIIIACGTISSNVLEEIKDEYNYKITGIIDVSCAEAIKLTKNNKIGVIATQATVNTKIFTKKIKKIKDAEVFEIACPNFAPLIEAGKKDSKEIEEAIKEYIDPLIEADVDTIIFGCTHYPILENKINKYINKNINYVNSGKLLSKELNVGIKKKPELEIYVSGDIEDFKNKAKELIDNNELEKVKNK